MVAIALLSGTAAPRAAAEPVVRVKVSRTADDETPIADPAIGAFATTDPGSMGAPSLPLANLVLEAVTHVKALAAALPLSAADEKLVDDLVRERVPASPTKKPLPRR